MGLRAALRPRSRAVVIGGGFIGCEVAGTLRTLGHHVTVVEPAGPPMQRVLGSDLAAAVQGHLTARGIEFVIGTGVVSFTGDDAVTGVELATGETLSADIVVEAIGSTCNVEWLYGQGLDLSDGVLTDNRLAVAGVADTVAVGDLARFLTRCLTTCHAVSSTGRFPAIRPTAQRPPWSVRTTMMRRSPQSRRSGATNSTCACKAMDHLLWPTPSTSRRAVSTTSPAA